MLNIQCSRRIYFRNEITSCNILVDSERTRMVGSHSGRRPLPGSSSLRVATYEVFAPFPSPPASYEEKRGEAGPSGPIAS